MGDSDLDDSDVLALGQRQKGDGTKEESKSRLLQAKDLFPIATKYHPNPAISKIKNRIVDNFVHEYAEFFYLKLHQLNSEVQILLKNLTGTISTHEV